MKRMVACFLCLMLAGVAASGEKEVTFTSSYDGSRQPAAVYIPESYRETDGQTRPLLVVAHYMSGNRLTAGKSGYYEECEKRGWLLICPELHGNRTAGATSLAAIPAQHDIVDAVAFMKQHYTVDETRVYLVGRSMGGMLALVAAAKYPDSFAAVVAGQSITDLARWTRENSSLRPLVEAECGGFSAETVFEYRRRSAQEYARNLAYVPLILWHGTGDKTVLPDHSERLAEEVRKYNRYLGPVCWLIGAGHNGQNYTPAWECDRLQYYQNTADGRNGAGRNHDALSLVTDEAKEIFWLEIVPANKGAFAGVTVSLEADPLVMKAENSAVISIDLDKARPAVVPSRYDICSDTPVCVRLKRRQKVLAEVTITGRAQGSFPRWQ